MHRYRIPASIVLGTLLAYVLLSGAPAGRAQTPPPYHDEVVRIIESFPEFDGHDTVDDRQAPCCRIDETAPVVVLQRAQDTLQRLVDGSDRLTRRALEAAQRSLDDAWTDLNHTATKSDRATSPASHLSATLSDLRQTVTSLGVARRLVRDGSAGAIETLQQDLTAAAARTANDFYDLASNAGVSERRLHPARVALDHAASSQDAGHFSPAIALYGAGLLLAGGTIGFDIDLFEQNIRDALDNETVGYTYAINVFDTLHSSDGIGDARIAPDGNPLPQEANKEMQLASVSKTLTAILVLRLLEQNGLTPDDPIGPWLPPDWVRGDGVDQQTFRDFMTHQTGFTQKGVAKNTVPTYANLQAAIAIDVPDDTDYDYNNSNFAIFRVIVPRLAGFDFDAFPGYTAEELNAGFFAYAALTLFDSVDISATCNTDHATKTIYYGFPPDGFNGLQTLDDYSLECGAYGFYLGAEDLAAVPADLVAGDDLLSDPSFQLMKQGFLGFFNPLDGYPWGWGALGIYYNHGGDWYTDTHSKGLGTCVMVFPNGVSATLEINSIGGNYGYQCEVLRAAFDNAWVPS